MADPQTLRRIMVDTQVRPSDVTKFPIIGAMLAIPREAFVPSSEEAVAYRDAPVPLAGGREMPAPRTIAKLLDAIDPEGHENVLIVGAGLGYSAALLSRMTASVVAVEEEGDMARDAEAALTAQGIDNAVVVTAPLTEGQPKAAPYDIILIEGGVEQIPDALVEQLKEGGRMAAIFMEGVLGEARIGVMAEGHMGWRTAFNADALVLPGFAKTRAFTL
ncbi:protein-L-isoaspartate O-methyltransferase family protein [Jannaschia aquimarina]|uniref:Protein-L-isoaspartate O-methyltransferase n=1 Tax=Jannaschia aquimarina TaxID=935700 RepID=A0A0D1CNI2_9RHOB|nr:protein-L-isoaspartate O-methyltransferase [Jannaschia aquimarina]KIT16282.1 Protein-L-isoaspartate O-methyltransferase [Jannaschia aquimarina]SNT14663.1 protein-L-isoaspartate(D-aspartate) O-methyltransferase [Jannaschia aquimarina]